MSKVVVGLAAGRKYENYSNWILQSPDTEVIKLSHEDNNFEAIKRCDGVILCGGEDVHPKHYKHPEFVQKYHLDDIDEARDEFELRVLDYTQSHRVALLGICRGLQIANVYFGGTLIPDIPSSGKPDHTKFGEGRDRYHDITVLPHSQLSEITGATTGVVNSAHHQGIDKVGEGLVVNARSLDGVVEGAELESKSGAFLMLVQWHPERMLEQESPFSKNIKENFLKNILKRN